MARYTVEAWRGKDLFVGIDMHRKQWHVTILNEDGLRLYSNRIAGTTEAIDRVLSRYGEAKKISSVYEAGYFGFWLYDFLVAMGVDAHVTPPSLIPSQSGSHVKTDRTDSLKLADYLRTGLLASIYVPTPQERAHRQVCRRRRQFIKDRVRVQLRIKAELQYTGMDLEEESRGRWSRRFEAALHDVTLGDPYAQESYDNLLEQYDELCEREARQTQMLRDLAQTDTYRDRVAILTSIPGVGCVSAMEILLELQDVSRFKNADALASYAGLTPGQYASGDNVRMGRITRQGKPMVRALLTQAAWRLIEKDPAMREKYERIKVRAGGKRAIVAIARRLLCCMRRILLNREPYQLGYIAG